MNDQDEMFEAAAELPASMMPAKVVVHDEPADEEQKRREIEHFSFCGGLFPIHTVRTPGGCMGKCEIGGRKFAFSVVDDSVPEDHTCTVLIWDGDRQVASMTVLRGHSITERIAMGAFKAYVKRLTGSNKFHAPGGFLKQAVKRLQEKDGPRTGDAGNALADWIIRNGALYDIPQFVIEQAKRLQEKGGEE